MVEKYGTGLHIPVTSPLLRQIFQSSSHSPKDTHQLLLGKHLSLRTVLLDYVLQSPGEVGELKIELHLRLMPTGQRRHRLLFDKMASQGQQMRMQQCFSFCDETQERRELFGFSVDELIGCCSVGTQVNQSPVVGVFNWFSGVRDKRLRRFCSSHHYIPTTY